MPPAARPAATGRAGSPAPPRRRPASPKRGLLGWVMILLGLTLLAGATTCIVQAVQCTCPGRIPCEDMPPSKRKYPCVQHELTNFYEIMKQKIKDLMTPKKSPDKIC